MNATGNTETLDRPALRKLFKPLENLQMALVLTRRELRDSFRDWRIMLPIIGLTLLFPLLMNVTASRMLGFVTDYGAEIIGTSLIPFLLLIVGFFPTSFSLVMALETFVGEKERNSLEPLLATPLSNAQIYLGKVMASMIPPLCASYLGIGIYLLGLWLSIGWTPTAQLLAQTVILTTVQGVVMVAAAVIVSSQTTSTRAANLFASFIIVPMALLVQLEAVVMFWGNHDGLWWLIGGLLVVASILVRMGIHLFDREEILGRDLDHIRVRWALRTFWARLTGRDEAGAYPNLWQWYRQTLCTVFRLRAALASAALALIGAAAIGHYLADVYVFPVEAQGLLREADFAGNIAELEGVISRLPFMILLHNARVVLIAVVLGLLTFGAMGLLVFMLPWILLSFVASQLQLAGESAATFLLATVAPHGLLELPALLLVAAAALSWQSAIIAPGHGKSLSEVWITGAANFMRISVGIALPLLIAAALVEANLTPAIVQLVYR